MNAIRLLMQQHDEVEGLLKRLLNADDEGPGARERYLRALNDALRLHVKLEEDHLYPELGNRSSEGLVELSYREHAKVVELLTALMDDPKGPGFLEKVRDLEEAVVQHNGDEEVDLFPEVKNLFTLQELETIGAKMEEQAEAWTGPAPAPIAEPVLPARNEAAVPPPGEPPTTS